MSSAQVTISQLPNAGPLTGTEAVPIVQNGQTVQTTAGAISGAGALNYPFLTVGSTAGLTDARYLSAGAGLSLNDNGAGSTLQVNMTGASLSLNYSGTGLIAKTGANTVTGRSLAVGSGLAVSNADGVSGNPTVSLGTFLNNFSSLTGTGMLAIQSGTVGKVNLLGTADQVNVTNGDGSGDATFSIASDPVIPGNGAMRVPVGTTAQQPSGTVGDFRYNSTTGTFDGYSSSGWNSFSLSGGVTKFSAGATGFTPNSLTSGEVTLDGTLNALHGGTGLSSYAQGDILYASGFSDLSKLSLGSSGYVLTAGASAPQYVAQSSLSVGSATTATNATNTAITANSTNSTYYLTFVSATTGNQPQLVNSSITVNPSTGSLTGGIFGGAF